MRIVDNPSEFRANIVVKLFDIIGDNKITTNLEKGILNYSIDVSNKQNIVKKWDNEFFVIIYTERLRTIMFNLNKNDALLQQIKNKANEIQKITVEFAYKQWRNMGTETTGIDFGHAMQTSANIKARTPGLFGKLPPSLQRAGKDIFQQGRTVLNPIGRIFKGKVFPPFT